MTPAAPARLSSPSQAMSQPALDIHVLSGVRRRHFSCTHRIQYLLMCDLQGFTDRGDLSVPVPVSSEGSGRPSKVNICTTESERSCRRECLLLSQSSVDRRHPRFGVERPEVMRPPGTTWKVPLGASEASCTPSLAEI
jgi:hypothetical protein